MWALASSIARGGPHRTKAGFEWFVEKQEGCRPMSAVLTPDIGVVGGGAAGVSLALEAAAFGLSVVLVEKNALGGARLTQSVPRNALIAVSRAATAVSGADEPRLGSAIDFARARAHLPLAVKAIAPNYAQARLEAMNVKVIRAAGRFTRPDTCEAGGNKIRAQRFVVATGAVEKCLFIPGLDLVRPLDCASLCALDHPPKRLIVIGADPDGLALAQAMRRFGSDVFVLSDTKAFSLQDEELTAPLRAEFARSGIALYESTRVLRIEPRGDGVRVFIAAAGHEKPISGSHLLIAAGRAPVVEGLGLAEAKVRYTANGIATGTGLRTSNRRIHAIGAVIKGAQYDGAAEQHAGVVLRFILGLPGGRSRRNAAPRVILTSPPIATTGLSEAQARAAYRHIHVLRWPFAETDKGQIEHQPSGHVKFIASRRGLILGAGIVGGGAEELINLCTLAISKGMTAEDLASIMVPYPALTDAVRRACMTFPAHGLNHSLTQRVLRVLRWFGQGLP
jgi:pyruvate/2-oxoglutarate dehydrogenase complex dihydrolipoamide dehydrogenase (E3) component